MNCVVKATKQTEYPTWLSRPDTNGARSLVIRKKADVFPGQEEARLAIAAMPSTLADSGVIFSVESSP